MRKSIVLGLGIATIFGILLFQRFVGPPTVNATIIDTQGETVLKLPESVKRGETINTDEEFLQLTIGTTSIYLAQRTTITIDRLFEHEQVITLNRGRIYINATDPLWIDTRKSQNLIENGTANLINYDFLEEVHIIPINGQIQTTIKDSNDYLLLPVPIALNELTGEYQQLDINLDGGDAATFYEWVTKNEL